MKTITLSLLLFFTLPAYAELVPEKGLSDKRIRSAVYDEGQVYRIAAKIGYASYIKFWEDEKMVSFFTGDKEGWDVGTHGTLAAFKPKVKNPTTNFVIVTNKNRVYNILFDLNRRKTDGHIIGLQFKYPEEERKKYETEQLAKKKQADEEALEHEKTLKSLDISYQTQVLELEKKRLELAATKKRLQEQASRKQQRESTIDPDQQDESKRNYGYVASGSDYLRPDIMFDNGRFTYLHFPEHMEWPAIFRVRKDKETLVNATIRNNWLIIPRLSREWHLRLDDEELCIKRTFRHVATVSRTAYSGRGQ